MTFASCEVCEDCTTKSYWDFPGNQNDYETKSVFEVCGKKEIKNAEGKVRTETVVNGQKVVIYTETICL
jgi:hypothetical protein